jgi:hypothetical protein
MLLQKRLTNFIDLITIQDREFHKSSASRKIPQYDNLEAVEEDWAYGGMKSDNIMDLFCIRCFLS